MKCFWCSLETAPVRLNPNTHILILKNPSQENSYFAYDNAFDACYSTGNTIWLKVQYKQTGNTGTDRRNELFGQFSTWVQATSFLPFTLLSDASCIGACSCCIEDSCMKAPTTIMARLKCSSNSRRKRSVGEDFPELSFDECKWKSHSLSATSSKWKLNHIFKLIGWKLFVPKGSRVL